MVVTVTTEPKPQMQRAQPVAQPAPRPVLERPAPTPEGLPVNDTDLCIVTRPLQGERMYEPGEAFRMARGRRREMLSRDHRIRDLERGEEVYTCACGRLWSGHERAERHCASDQS